MENKRSRQIMVAMIIADATLVVALGGAGLSPGASFFFAVSTSAFVTVLCLIVEDVGDRIVKTIKERPSEMPYSPGTGYSPAGPPVFEKGINGGGGHSGMA